MFGHRGGWRRTSRRIEAVHKAARRVEDFPGLVVSRDAAVAFATRAVGARETDERAGVAREAEEIADNSEENAAVAFATRAGGAQETGEIFSSKY